MTFNFNPRPHVVYAWPEDRSTHLHKNRLLKDLTPFEPLMQKHAGLYGQLGGTYVLDGVIDWQVSGIINTGLRKIGIGQATPEEVAQENQSALSMIRI